MSLKAIEYKIYKIEVNDSWIKNNLFILLISYTICIYKFVRTLKFARPAPKN